VGDFPPGLSFSPAKMVTSHQPVLKKLLLHSFHGLFEYILSMSPGSAISRESWSTSEMISLIKGFESESMELTHEMAHRLACLNRDATKNVYHINLCDRRVVVSTHYPSIVTVWILHIEDLDIIGIPVVGYSFQITAIWHP